MKSSELHISIIGAFFATLLSSFFSYQILEADAMPVVLASTGASAMLIFGLPHSPVSQPWNLVGGHLSSAFVGICCYKLIPHPVFASSCAIPIAMFLMHQLRCMHPPGGATAITAVIGGATVHELGFNFMIIPVFFNSIILLSIAIAAGSFRENNPFEVKPSEVKPH
jgi:CBS domain-containing membrane protein